MDYHFDPDSEKLLSNGECGISQRQGAVFYFSKLQCTLLSIFIGVFFLLQILTLGVSIGNGSASLSDRKYNVWKDCGNNASEARDRGCIFDVMMTGWVKEDCYNKALSEQYLLEGKFQFFSDAEATKEIPMDIIRLGEHTSMWTNDLHHRAHCVYVWKLQALALESQAQGKVKLIDSESYTLDHTEHCARILVNSIPSPPYSLNYGEVDFLRCGPYLSQ